MSTALLHYGANERKHQMLQKLGGQKVLTEATDRFYDRQINDKRLLKFFHGTDLAILKWHQFNLMSIAFTAVPENFDVRHLILKRHQKLFDEGLDETYFDVVMDHFKSTLTEMKVDPDIIDAAVEVVMHLREYFVQGAFEAKERKLQKTQQELRTKKLVAASVVATLILIAFRLSKKSSKRI